jgi:hypothetical protein
VFIFVAMRNFKANTGTRSIAKKLAVLFLITVTGMVSFATLGDGNKKSESSKRSLVISGRNNIRQGSFSLRSGYSFRGSQVINTQQERNYIRLNTIVTMQKGNTTYIVPLKKKVGIGNVKINIGNRQFQRN